MPSSSSRTWLDLYRQDPERAWDNFVQTYNRLIMVVIGEFLEDHDRAMDLYAYTLECFKNNNCKRLTTYFDKPRRYRFETWIALCVRHSCIDWFRKEKGQKRLIKCIKALPEIEQCIFRYIYWQGYSSEIAHELLKTNHGFQISFTEFSEHLDRIDRILKSETRWKIEKGLQFHHLSSLHDPDHLANGGDPLSGLANPSFPASEKQLLQSECREILRNLLLSLSPEEQLLIQLRFFRGLTLEEIARVLKIKNLWRASRKLEKALKTLRKKLEDQGIHPSDLET